MRDGIHVDVLLQTKEEMQNGVWVVMERNILRVYGTSPAPVQKDLEMPKAAIEPKDQANKD